MLTARGWEHLTVLGRGARRSVRGCGRHDDQQRKTGDNGTGRHSGYRITEPVEPIADRRPRASFAVATTLAVATVLAVVAYRGGSYAIEDRSAFGLLVAWALLLGAVFGVLPRAPVPRAAVVAMLGMAGFTAWTGLSLLWAPSAEHAFDELARVLVYAALLSLVACAASRGSAAAWADGLALGVTAVATLALLERFFPSLFNDSLDRYLPGASVRLSFPLEYWNGLGLLVGFSVPLFFRTAVANRRRVVAAVAVAPLPALVVVLYLTSSRGGFIVAAVSFVALVALTRRGFEVMARAAVAGLGSAVAVVYVAGRHALVDGPLRTPAAAAEGHRAFGVVVVVCALVALGNALVAPLARRVAVPRPFGIAAWVVGALVVVAVVAASHPRGRLHRFETPPPLAHQRLQQHLLAGGGSGRWQFWQAAVAAWRTEPLHGRGAGTYESWWAAHGTLPVFVRDAHSLYLQLLAELGTVGLLLLLVAFAAGIATVAGRRARCPDGITVAALAAVGAGWAVANGIDWIWQLTAVGAVGIVVLGLLTGPATVAGAGERRVPVRARRVLRFGAVATAVVVAGLEAIPLLTQLRVDAAQAASSRGDVRHSVNDALAARALEPWSATPYTVLGLVAEQAGDLASAEAWIRAAAARDPQNWRIWLIAARIETKRGEIDAARRDLHRAARLDAHSPLFGG